MVLLSPQKMSQAELGEKYKGIILFINESVITKAYNKIMKLIEVCEYNNVHIIVINTSYLSDEAYKILERLSFTYLPALVYVDIEQDVINQKKTHFTSLSDEQLERFVSTYGKEGVWAAT